MRATSLAWGALVCLVSVALTGGTANAGGVEKSPRGAVGAPTKLRRAYYYAPESKSPSTLYVYLHGICGRAENGCAAFAGIAPSSWLLCPRAPVACGASDSWSDGATARRVVSSAATELQQAEPAIRRSTRGNGAIAFSQGGYVFQDMVRSGANDFDRALILGAEVGLGAAELRKAGVKRAAFGAGKYDGTFAALQRTVKRLVAEGYPARFVDLGSVGHTYVPEPGNDALETALRWLDEVDG